MPRVSPALISLLTVWPSGALSVLSSQLWNALPYAWSVLLALTAVCGMVCAIANLLPPAPPKNQQIFRKRQQLLAAVSQEVTARLKQSWHSAVLVNLVEEQELQLVRPDADVKIGDSPRFQLQPEDSIAKVFEDTGNKLLILGGAGAGKTTMLLELALELCQRAESDPGAGVPVVLRLSFWKNDQPVAEWLVAELKSKYGLPADLGRRWLNGGELLLLLDGLDELEASRQEKCIEAINQLLEENPQPAQVAVCTRYNEYKNCQSRLRLNGAIFLRPLTDAQIRTYLVAARSRELWYNIESEPQLLALARTPLLLSVMTLAYEEILIHSWKRLTSKEELRQYLFNAYIRRMLGREINPRKQPSSEKTRHWLIWLAQRMEQENQAEFLIEKMHPDWLQTPTQKRLYRMVAALAGGFIPGLAFMRHFVLRLILWRSGYIPWNYARFLNYAAQRLFVQRAGKRYQFTHKLLQEHFAEMPLNS
jgi:predicted NACHT family NTPase